MCLDADAEMQCFSCSTKSVFLEARGSGSVDIQFLPFQTGKRQCFVIFANTEIGEFLYAIDAMGCLPQSTTLPFNGSPASMRITSAAAAGT